MFLVPQLLFARNDGGEAIVIGIITGLIFTGIFGFIGFVKGKKQDMKEKKQERERLANIFEYHYHQIYVNDIPQGIEKIDHIVKIDDDTINVSEPSLRIYEIINKQIDPKNSVYYCKCDNMEYVIIFNKELKELHISYSSILYRFSYYPMIESLTL